MTRCVQCERDVDEALITRSSGLAITVFGPFFDDRKPRCGDCYAARFWRAACAATAILGAAIAISGALSGRVGGVIGGIVIGTVFSVLSWRRARTFDVTE